jgi:cytochrome c oxidase subunit 2
MNSLFLPEQATDYAARVDALYIFLCCVAAFFSLLILVLIVAFTLRYRRSSSRTRRSPIHGSIRLEILWTAIPLVLTMAMFAWGTTLYFESATPPRDALDVFVVGKQWMWKLQHPSGRREINQLHVPRGTPVRLTIASEDVIHSFYVPAFRIKMDAVPGRYSHTWFTATRTGTYHLFCAEYCGTNHSQMTGQVVVMEPAAYQAWLQGGGQETMPDAGQQLFVRLGCQTCHPTQRAPSFLGQFGQTVQLSNGETVVIDEAYLRESILDPGAKVVAGFEPVMPTYRGQISEEGILQIIAYIKSLSAEELPEVQKVPEVEP